MTTPTDDRELLALIESALEQAHSCIQSETPEDVTFGEAEDDTVSKIRAALEVVSKLRSAALPKQAAREQLARNMAVALRDNETEWQSFLPNADMLLLRPKQAEPVKEMPEPYLVAHVVRGQPAFDIAEQMTCPICQGITCDECEEGHWWIIPTSGHRAYPYWYKAIDLLLYDQELCHSAYTPANLLDGVPSPPLGHPDHYAINNRELRSANLPTLADRLGLNQRQSSAPIKRRV